MDADVWVVDMGIIPDLDPASLEKGERLLIRKVAKGTANFAKGPAMTRQEAEKAILTGFQLATDLFQKGVEILGTGDMGIMEGAVRIFQDMLTFEEAGVSDKES